MNEKNSGKSSDKNSSDRNTAGKSGTKNATDKNATDRNLGHRNIGGRNILVTGGAGFIGSALSHRLAEDSARFLVVDNLLAQVHPSQRRPRDLSKSAELVIQDVSEKMTWDKLLQDFRPDIVIHLAAETGTGQSLTEASRHARTNVLGLTELLDAMCEHKIVPEQILLTSSRAVYGEGAWKKSDGQVFYPGQRSNAQLSNGQWDFLGTSLPAIAGQTKENPTSVYGATKLAQENLLKSWAFSFAVPLSILRLQNVYGPGQSPFNPYTGIVILFSQLAQAKRAIELYEDGMMTRDFVYIDDVVEAIEKAVLTAPASGGYRQLDIGSGVQATLMELAEMISSFHSAPPAVICGKYRNGDVRHAGCEILAAAQDLSWTPKWSLAAGMTALQEHLAASDLAKLTSD
jgi:dTDP-L-rhamnose 4-epimerase